MRDVGKEEKSECEFVYHFSEGLVSDGRVRRVIVCWRVRNVLLWKRCLGNVSRNETYKILPIILFKL